MPCCTPRVSPEGSGSCEAFKQDALSFLVALEHFVDGGLGKGKARGIEASYSGHVSGDRGGDGWGHKQRV